MSTSELRALLIEAAHEGAKEALREVGLGDENAGSDIRDLRSLLQAWRQVSHGALIQFGKMLVLALLVLLAWALGHTKFFSLGG